MHESLKKNNLIVDLSFKLAVACVSFSTVLEQGRKWSLANQILRAALSIGANIKEAQNSESRADFVHKLKIAGKEAEELEFYFEVCNASSELPDAGDLLSQTQSVIRVLNKIISTTKQKANDVLNRDNI